MTQYQASQERSKKIAAYLKAHKTERLSDVAKRFAVSRQRIHDIAGKIGLRVVPIGKARYFFCRYCQEKKPLLPGEDYRKQTCNHSEALLLRLHGPRKAGAK